MLPDAWARTRPPAPQVRRGLRAGRHPVGCGGPAWSRPRIWGPDRWSRAVVEAADLEAVRAALRGPVGWVGPQTGRGAAGFASVVPAGPALARNLRSLSYRLLARGPTEGALMGRYLEDVAAALRERPAPHRAVVADHRPVAERRPRDHPLHRLGRPARLGGLHTRPLCTTEISFCMSLRPRHADHPHMMRSVPMSETSEDTTDDLLRHWRAMAELGEAVPGSGLASMAEALRAKASCPRPGSDVAQRPLPHCPNGNLTIVPLRRPERTARRRPVSFPAEGLLSRVCGGGVGGYRCWGQCLVPCHPGAGPAGEGETHRGESRPQPLRPPAVSPGQCRHVTKWHGSHRSATTAADAGIPGAGIPSPTRWRRFRAARAGTVRRGAGRPGPRGSGRSRRGSRSLDGS